MSYKNIILCDLDGTLANVGHRLHYLKNPDGTLKPQKERDWGSFHKACVDDKPYEDVIAVLKALIRGWGAHGCHMCGAIDRDVYILSGRNDSVRTETVEWLQKHVAYDYEHWSDHLDELLVMRKADDRRPDTEVKLEMVRELGLTPDDVLCVLDDRQRVVDMWRDNGFRCLQVNAWEE